MSQHVAENTKRFQRFADNTGESLPHGCDMERGESLKRRVAMGAHELEAVVAAILTAGSRGGPANQTAQQMVSFYRATIDELQKTGGQLNPKRPLPG